MNKRCLLQVSTIETPDSLISYIGDCILYTVPPLINTAVSTSFENTTLLEHTTAELGWAYKYSVQSTEHVPL